MTKFYPKICEVCGKEFDENLFTICNECLDKDQINQLKGKENESIF